VGLKTGCRESGLEARGEERNHADQAEEQSRSQRLGEARAAEEHDAEGAVPKHFEAVPLGRAHELDAVLEVTSVLA